MSGTGRVAVCTTITASFLAHARVMLHSVRERHPDVSLFAAVTERPQALHGRPVETFDCVPLADLDLPDPLRYAFLSSPHELTVQAKPRILRHLLDQGFETVVFLDSDILVTGDLAPVFAVAAAHAVTLTPHLVRPPAGADRIARELAISRAGTFNGGFVAVSARPAADGFLAWWGGRLLTHNRLEPTAGLHHDQRWLDLAPGLFGDVAILRDPGCNVAYWNLPERPMRVDGDRVELASGPCRFVHFSGFDPSRPAVLSRHAPELTPDQLDPAVSLLLERYADALRREGWEEARKVPYSFGAYDDGLPIPAVARRLYRSLGEAAAGFGDPFRSVGRGTFRAWLAEVDDAPGPGAGLDRLWRRVYQERPDLQRAFPDPAGADGDRFLRWVANSGRREYGVGGPA